MKKVINILILMIIFSALIWGGLNYTWMKIGFQTPGELENDANYVQELIAKKAIVGNVEMGEWSLILDDGSDLILEGRSIVYAVQNRFIPSEGDVILLSGFLDELGNFEIAGMKNVDSGAELTLRDQNGQPLWGRGGGGNRK